jgi:Tol biopolymer transport system component
MGVVSAGSNKYLYILAGSLISLLVPHCRGINVASEWRKVHNVRANGEVAKIPVTPPAEVTWEGAKWSSDGRKIAWVERSDGTSSLNVYCLNSSRKEAITVQGGISTFGWHPKGERIVISLHEPGGGPMPQPSHLKEVVLTTGRVQPLACVSEISGSLMQPAYSWRGDKLASVFHARGDAGLKIVVVDTSQRAPVTVVADKHLNQRPTWLPDDAGLIYQKSVPTISAGMQKFFALKLLDRDSAEILLDSTEYHSSYFASIRGDGLRVRYLKYPKAARRIPQLWEYNLSTEERAMLVDFEDIFGTDCEIRGLGFAAGGVDPCVALGVNSRDERMAGVWVISIAGRMATRVADSPNAGWPQMSPVGERVSFVSADAVIVLDVPVLFE